MPGDAGDDPDREFEIGVHTWCSWCWRLEQPKALFLSVIEMRWGKILMHIMPLFIWRMG